MREVGNFDYIVNQSTPNSIVTIWDASLALEEIISAIDPREHYTVSTFLESLRLDIYLPSFNKAEFPAIYPEMSAAEKAVEMMKVEAKSPKCGLAFYRKRVDEDNWHYLSEIILQNRGRRAQIPVVVPHFTTNQLKMLHRHTQIGIKKLDYGNGVIGNGPIVANRDLDQVQIEGDFRVDIDQSEFKRNRRISIQDEFLIGDSRQIIIDRNINRAYFEIQNNGSRLLLLMFGNSPTNSRTLWLRPGSLYHPPEGHVLTETISGETQTGETLVNFYEMEYY
jgi:hypothetical protein